MEMWKKRSLKAKAVFREDHDIAMSQEKWQERRWHLGQKKKIPEYQKEVGFSIWRKKTANIRVSWKEKKKKLHWFPIVVTNKFINEVEKLITYNRQVSD